MRTTRRKLLLGIGGLTAGSIALNQTTQNASAANVEVDSLSVPDSKHVTTEEIRDVRLNAKGTWTYSGNVKPDRWELELRAGNREDATHPLATVSESQDLGKEESGEFSLTGSLLDSPHFDMSNFALAGNGSEKRTPFIAQLRFRVYRDKDVVAEAEVSDRATITVTREAVKIDASLGGSGEVTIVTDG